MVNEEEFAICQRRGHETSFYVLGGWSNCKLCGFWVREFTKLEERSEKPPDEEINGQAATPTVHSSTGALATVSTEEYAFCKRRRHKVEGGPLGAEWRRCKFCGTWVREVTTQEVREDTPPEEEMSIGDKMLRMRDAVLRRNKALKRLETIAGASGTPTVR